MKKVFAVLLLVLLLTGCGQPQLPDHWEADWTVVCPVLAVEPLEGFELNESNDALYLSGIYYATWTSGEPRPHTNEKGEEAEIFDAQIYVLANEFRNEAAAAAEVKKWKAREAQTYQTGNSYPLNVGGQDFEVLPLLDAGEANPYTGGMAAFAVCGAWACCVELVHAEDFDGDAAAILEAFLSGFHYN